MALHGEGWRARGISPCKAGVSSDRVTGFFLEGWEPQGICIFSPLKEPAIQFQVLSSWWSLSYRCPKWAPIRPQHCDVVSSSVSDPKAEAAFRGRVVTLLSPDSPGSVPGRQRRMRMSLTGGAYPLF